MYTLLKNVILAGNTPVDVLTHKVNVAWAGGNITDEQKLELEKLIFKYKNPQTESPDLSELYMRLKEEVEKLKERVSALESGEEGGGGEEPPSAIVPEWEPWDGINNQYQYGDVVLHNEKYWINALNGIQNTWEPEGADVDERYWKEITKEQAEGIINGDLTVDDILGTASEV